jgi:hypothetical protein
VIVLGDLSIIDRAGLLYHLYPFIGTGYGTARGLLLVVVAGVFGINAALVSYRLRGNRPTINESAGGVAGIVLAVLGGGCAACGPVVLGGALSAIGLSSVLAAVPYDGTGLLLLSLALLGVSVVALAMEDTGECDLPGS